MSYVLNVFKEMYLKSLTNIKKLDIDITTKDLFWICQSERQLTQHVKLVF
jgi:hypothetical protein